MPHLDDLRSMPGDLFAYVLYTGRVVDTRFSEPPAGKILQIALGFFAEQDLAVVAEDQSGLTWWKYEEEFIT
jgi:hypothetical protein